jgi:DNA-binding transcriptional LysR family regulator
MDSVRKKTNKKLKIFSIIGTSEALKMSIIAGTAPGIISKFAIQKELRNGVLNAVNIKGISLKRPFYLVLKDLKNASLACKTFIKMFDV